MTEELDNNEEFFQSMPRIGLGAFSLDSEELTIERFKEFLENGGRLIEIAELFSNFQHLLPALDQCGILREELILIVRIWPQNYSPTALQSRIERFLELSKFLYIDILLTHAPIDIANRFEQWQALEACKRKGLVRALGLSNMSLNQLLTVIKDATILPSFFFTEISPFKQQRELIDYCQVASIVVINVEPCCKGIRNRLPKVMELCQRLQASPEQILFRWSLTKGYVTLIPSTNKSVGLDPIFLNKPLLEDIMTIMEEWDEDKGSAWAPIVDEDN